VYHPDLEDPFFPAGGDVVRQEVFDFPGPKGVQVQDSVDREFQRLKLIDGLFIPVLGHNGRSRSDS
jgi:hypothetical protein